MAGRDRTSHSSRDRVRKSGQRGLFAETSVESGFSGGHERNRHARKAASTARNVEMYADRKRSWSNRVSGDLRGVVVGSFASSLARGVPVDKQGPPKKRSFDFPNLVSHDLCPALQTNDRIEKGDKFRDQKTLGWLSTVLSSQASLVVGR
jgi:hypothetical protein